MQFFIFLATTESLDLEGHFQAILDQAGKQLGELAERAKPWRQCALEFMALRRTLGHHREYDPYPWDFNASFGLYVQVNLKVNEGFDAAHPYLELVERHAEALGMTQEPRVDTLAEIRRRTLTWKDPAGVPAFSLMMFGHQESPHCRLVPVGTETRYELVCDGSPLPVASSPEG